MSTLTKILIVLLTLSTIFLCGITVTYVGTATNYKEAWKGRQSKIDSLTKDNEYKDEQINDLNAKMKTTQDKLDGTIAELQKEIVDKGVEIDNYKRNLSDAQTRLENNNAELVDNAKTVALNNNLRQKAETENAELKQIKEDSETQIKQLNDAIVTKDTKIDEFETKIKQLIEEKTQIQNKLDQLLQLTGQRAFTPEPVTASSDPAKAAQSIKALGLEGVVNEIRPQDSMVSISLGSAKGVKDGMRFHVIRADKFVCDIVIFSVDADQSSGYFDLASGNQPRPGDIVKTNF